jgi:hypothetical protein
MGVEGAGLIQRAECLSEMDVRRLQLFGKVCVLIVRKQEAKNGKTKIVSQ